MKFINIDKSFINGNIKLFIRFCKIHGLYGFITKHYGSIFNLSDDLNGRRVSTYVSVLLNNEYISYITNYYNDCDLALKQIERNKKTNKLNELWHETNKLNELWHEFAKEQIKKDDEYHTARSDFFTSYWSTDLEQILNDMNDVIYTYVNNDITKLIEND